jgi:hypothetical protein
VCEKRKEEKKTKRKTKKKEKKEPVDFKRVNPLIKSFFKN